MNLYVERPVAAKGLRAAAGWMCTIFWTFGALAGEPGQTDPASNRTEQAAATASPQSELKAAMRLSDYGLPGLDKKVYLQTLIPWNVVQLIEFLANEGGLKNVVISKGISEAGITTKLTFNGVNVADALEVVLTVNNLAYEVRGGIITIMTDAEYRAKCGTGFYDYKKVRVVDLKYADASRVASMLEKLKSDIGTIVADPLTGTLILIDTPARMEEMQAVVNKADMPTVTRVLPSETRTFVLQYAKVEDVQPEVAALLTKDAGTLRVDKRTRTLIVTDLPHNLEKIEHLVKAFDVRPRQVFIEAKIVETTLSDDFSMGINWSHLFDGFKPDFRLHSVVSPGGPTPPVLSLTYSTVRAEGDLEVILSALKTVGETKILSNPHIAVMDGQEARIQVIEDQPYKEIGLESGTTNITSVKYQFKPVGVQLGVTPRVNDEGFITVLIKPEISSISQWYDGAPQEGTPVIRKALAETQVMVADGVTIIIGGLIRDRRDERVNGVPILSGIPLLGSLFKYESVSTVKTETVVFMTPRMIGGDQPVLLMKDIKKTPKPLRAAEHGDRQMKALR